MTILSTLMRQHQELLQIIIEISAGLDDNGKLTANSDAIQKSLSKLAGKLIAHLAVEDNVFYPALLSCNDQVVISTARQFIDEMSGLKQVFTQYMDKWSTAIEIQKNPGEFSKETKNVFSAIKNRMQREESILYPLAAKKVLV